MDLERLRVIGFDPDDEDGGVTDRVRAGGEVGPVRDPDCCCCGRPCCLPPDDDGRFTSFLLSRPMTFTED